MGTDRGQVSEHNRRWPEPVVLKLADLIDEYSRGYRGAENILDALLGDPETHHCRECWREMHDRNECVKCGGLVVPVYCLPHEEEA